MKRLLLVGLILLMGCAVFAQRAQLKKGIPTAKAVTGQQISVEPEKANSTVPVAPASSAAKGTDVVNVITIGTSANANGYGYAGGQKTMVWADDSLDALINVHRMGPGSTPPGFSGYLAIDKAGNMGQTAGDWTTNWQIYASTLNTGGTYYLDAGRYPQGAIYAPYGATSLDDAWVAYFAPNLSNSTSASSWGGYSYGTVDLGNQADSTKHMYWYSAPPYTYIPDGYTITQKGIALGTDLDQDWSSGSMVYMGNIILIRGIWNATNNDFDYEFSTIPFPTTDAQRPAEDRIAASPDGNTVWILAQSHNGGAVQIGDSGNYYPILFKSNDAGMTWSDPIAVQLDGPDGIEGVKNYMSDYMIEQLYGQLVPRDDIPYTTAFDGDIVVDKWGNPHIGVIIGVSAGDYSIATSDSAYAVFDIYSTDGGTTWNGVVMGYPWTFRGTFGTLTEDNRVNIAINEPGDHVFVTWNDTQVSGIDDNTSPDVFARGFNLLENKITNYNGQDMNTNVTFLSDITQQAYFECTSHYVFTKPNGGHIIPIVTELLQNLDPTLSVTFKYISDFSYDPGDYTIEVNNPPFPTGVNEKTESVSVQVYPNPVKDIATLSVNLKQAGNLTIELTNLVGQKVMSVNKGNVTAGSQTFTVDASQLKAGVYFYTVKLNDQKTTGKIVVE
jgi:hypothetical protein